MAEANLTIRLDPELRERLQRAIDENVRLRAEVTDLRQQLGRVQDTINAEKWGASEYGYDVPSWVVNLEMDIGAAVQTEPQPAEECREFYGGGLGIQFRCHRPKGHDGRHWRSDPVAGLTVDKEGQQ